MPAWNSRQMPHPLLAPWSDDYDEESRFAATVPGAVLTGSGSINLHIQYDLCSPTLADLIDQGKAQYVALLACAHTFARESYATEYPEQHLSLKATDYADTLLFTPHICAVADVEGFTSPEHSPEYAAVRPNGFDITGDRHPGHRRDHRHRPGVEQQPVLGNRLSGGRGHECG